MPLPTNGELNWGTPLNSDILVDEAAISTNTTAIANHGANIPADPHGDRAYALSLTTPITTGLNLAPTATSLGLVQLTSAGKIPLSLVPTGAGLTTFVDAVPNLSLATNGADISGNLNAGIATLSAAGGGIMYMGSGTFGLAAPIVMQPNVWLMCSPGAVFNRLLVTTVPPWMITNFAFGVSPSGGNMWVSGGTWNVANLARTGSLFAFANANFINIRDLTVVGYPDGLSPIGRLYGCTNVNIDNVQISAAACINSGRSNQTLPVFEIEELNVINIPGIPAGTYNNQECSNIHIRGCALNAVTSSDSSGAYTAWTSFCGTKGTIVSGNLHVNINVLDGCYASGLAVAAVEVKNWQNLNCTGNQFSFPGLPYVATWTGTVALVASFLFDTNSPRSYPAYELVQVTGTISETTCAQFSIPANDWIPGTTAYRHHHSGNITVGTTSGKHITFRIYLGTNGNNTDNLIQTIGPLAVTASQTTIPYSVNHRGFDIDVNGYWTDCGVEFLSTCCTTAAQNVLIQAGSTRILLSRGSKLYITITAQWDINSVSYILVPTGGCVERCNQ